MKRRSALCDELAAPAAIRERAADFFTACTAERRAVLANQGAFESLHETWQKSAQADGWFVGRFVLMPDHVHLFARAARDAKPCADWVKTWKSISLRKIARAFAIEPPIWQRDYFDHFVRSAAAYSEKWDYVRQNPVRKNLVASPENWPWMGVIHDLEF